MAEIKCPMDKPYCVTDVPNMPAEMSCAWRIGGKCAAVVIAEKLEDLANVIGAMKRKPLLGGKDK